MMKSLQILVAGLTGAIVTLVQPFGTCHRAFGQTTEKVKEEEVYLTDDETINQEREEKAHQIAQNTTVFIQNSNDSENFGSGVIIAKEGNTYAVLTAAHVLEANGPFTIKIKDEFQYPVKNIQKLPNVDLARFQFESDENFGVAPLGEFEQVREADEVYVAGYPTPGFNIQRPVFFILPGNVTTIFPEAGRDGYNIAYDNFTRSGMSGGPVFNKYGHVIAIHGRKETNEDGSIPSQWVNLGIPIVLYKQSIPIVQQQHPQHKHLWTYFEHRWVRPRFVRREDAYSTPPPSYQQSDHSDDQMSDPEPETEHKPEKPVQSKTKTKSKTVIPAQKTRLKSKPKTEAKVKPKVKPNPEAKSGSKTRPKAKPKDKARPKVKSDFGAKSAREILPKAKDKASAGKRPQSKPGSGTKPVSKTRPKAKLKDKARPKVKSDFGAKSAREILPKAKDKASAGKRPQAKPGSGTKPVSKTQPKAKAKAKARAKAKAKAKASKQKSSKVKGNSGSKSAKKSWLKARPKTK